MAAAPASIEANGKRDLGESVSSCQLITDNEMKAWLQRLSTPVVFLFRFIPACCRKCDPSGMTTHPVFDASLGFFFCKTEQKDLSCACSCRIAVAAALLSERVYVQDLRRHMTAPRVPDSFWRTTTSWRQPSPAWDYAASLVPPRVSSMWTSKSKLSTADAGNYRASERARMFQQQMESPDVMLICPRCRQQDSTGDPTSHRRTGGAVLSPRPDGRRPGAIWPTSMEKPV